MNQRKLAHGLAAGWLLCTAASATALGIASHDGEITGWCEDDAEVGLSDIQFLLSQWGPCAESGPCDADLNGNGYVAEGDLAILIAHWGPCELPGDINGDGEQNLEDLMKAGADDGLNCRADLDFNGTVDAGDLALAELEWTRGYESPDEHPGVPLVDGDADLSIVDVLAVADDLGLDCRSDVNHDGEVDTADLICVCLYLGYEESDCDFESGT